MGKLMLRSTYIEETGESIVERLNDPVWFWGTKDFVADMQESCLAGGRKFSDWGYVVADTEEAQALVLFVKWWLLRPYGCWRMVQSLAWHLVVLPVVRVKMLLHECGLCVSPDGRHWKDILFNWKSIEGDKAWQEARQRRFYRDVTHWFERERKDRTLHVNAKGEVR